MEKYNTRTRLQEISKITIEILRELATSGREVNAENLSGALGSRMEILAIVDPSSGVPVDKEESVVNDDDHLKEIERVRNQKDTLLKQYEKLEDEYGKSKEIYKRAVSVLAEAAGLNENLKKIKGLSDLNTILSKDSSSEYLQQLIKDVKNFVITEGVKDTAQSEKELKKGTIFKRLLRKDEKRVNGQSLDNLYIEQFRNTYQDIINQLGLELGPEFFEKLTRAGLSLNRISKVDQFKEVREEILTILHEYLNNVNLNRETTAAFVMEIGGKLVSFDEFLSELISGSGFSYKSADEFSRVIERQVDDLKKNVDYSKNLEDLKQIVTSRLNSMSDEIKKFAQEDIKRRKGLHKKLEFLQEDLGNMKKEVAQEQSRARELEDELLKDPLTGVYNRRAYDKWIMDEFQRFLRYKRVFSALLFDVDRFKVINDTYGHTVGDKCLQEIALRAKNTLRENDRIARYGGEEFIVLMPETDEKNAVTAAERIRKAIETIEFIHKDESIHITVSLGVTQVSIDDQSIENIFYRMDMAMYSAKSSGRNRVVFK